MKTLIRFTALIVFCVVAYQWYQGARSWELVTLAAATIVTVFWSCGGFDKSVWFGSAEVDAECVRVDAELDALEAATVPSRFGRERAKA